MADKLNPLVTIAIPTFNRADSYLNGVIQCALNQTYSNIEILVSDNCSADTTEAVVRSYEDSRLKYVKQSVNVGGHNNVNWCVNHAMGVYVLILHDDDRIDHDFIEVCMKAANFSTDVGIIRTGARVIDTFGKVVREKENIAAGLSNEKFILAFLERKLHMFLAGTLFNTQRLKQIGGFHTLFNLWDDVHAEFQLAVKFGRVDVSEVKGSLRSHGSSRTNMVNLMDWIEDSIFLLDALCDLDPMNSELIRNRGRNYFAFNCYNISRKIRTPTKRFSAYLNIYQRFKVFPPHIVNPIAEIFSKTPLKVPLSFMKRKLGFVGK